MKTTRLTALLRAQEAQKKYSQGKTIPEIAKEMGLSQWCIRNYVMNHQSGALLQTLIDNELPKSKQQ